jgi:hypothetical protein
MDIRHGKRRVDDPGERGDILELLERLVANDCVEQLSVGEDSRRHAHVRP